MLELRNPHSILAAIEKRPRDVREIRAVSHSKGAWDDVVRLAESRRIPIRPAQPQRKGRRGDDGRSGNSALVSERSSINASALFGDVEGSPHGIWLALDHLTDPHNVGAIFRTAGFFGVRGIILTRDRSAPLTSTVYDVSSGGVEAVPFAIETNLARVFDEAKKAGLWILGASEHAERDIREFSLDRHWLLAIGNEERGLRRLTLERCDEQCAISPRGDVGSLNASVAAAVLLASLLG